MLLFPLLTKFNSHFVSVFELKRNITSYGLSQFLKSYLPYWSFYVYWKNKIEVISPSWFFKCVCSVQKAHDISKCIQISSFKNTCHFHFLPCATSNLILWGIVITLLIVYNKNILYMYSYNPIGFIDVCIVLVHQLP